MGKSYTKHIQIVSMLILFVLFISATAIFATDSMYVWSDTTQIIETSVAGTEEVNAEESSGNSLNLESGAAILIEQNTGKILYEHNSHEQLRPASVTKIMSMLLIMEALDSGRITLEDNVSCSEIASNMGGSQIWLDTTETLTVHEMLKAIAVASANDCVVAMAEYLCGSQEAFVQKMNERAKELGMNDTTFKNCHGLDEDGHVTSAYDISLMSKELLVNDPSITNYTTIWMDTLRDGKSELVNTNKLIRNYEGATGLKTGSTSLALYNLSASATRNDLSLIAVIMKAPSTKVRFAEAQKLLDYGFTNYSYKEFGKKGDIVKSLNVDKGVESSVNAILKEAAGTIMTKGKESQIVQNITLNEELSAPIVKGQKLGEVTFSLENEIIATIDIIAEKDIGKNGFINMFTHLYKSWFKLLR